MISRSELSFQIAKACSDFNVQAKDFTAIRHTRPAVQARERVIAYLHVRGASGSAIARMLGMHHTTVSDALRRSRVKSEVYRLSRLLPQGEVPAIDLSGEWAI